MGYAKRVLLAYVTDGQTGGVDKYIMGYYETLKNCVHFDFLTNKKDFTLESKLAKEGVKLIEVSSLKHPFRQKNEIISILREGQYDAFYLNTSTALSYISMKAAYECNIPLRICHSHASGIDSGSFFNRILLKVIHIYGKGRMVKYANRYQACSPVAAKWMYTEDIVLKNQYVFVHNAFPVEEYVFSSKKRSEVRRNLNLESKTVVGFIGSLCYPKNIPFALDIFSEVKKKISDAVFMVVGDGPLLEFAKEKAAELSVADSVMFLGWRNDVKDLIQAMDLLLAPSIFEGLSFVSLEAQAAGLRCFFSTNITEATAVTPYCTFLDLHVPPQEWAATMIKNMNYQRENTYRYFEEEGYVLSKVKDIYMDLLNQGD